MGFYKDRRMRHFRVHRTKNGVHPSYIIGSRRGSYLYLGLTHKKTKGRKHKNHAPSKNQKAGDGSVAYIRKKIEEDRKTSFTTKKFENHKMQSEDDDYVDSLIVKCKAK